MLASWTEDSETLERVYTLSRVSETLERVCNLSRVNFHLRHPKAIERQADPEKIRHYVLGLQKPMRNGQEATVPFLWTNCSHCELLFLCHVSPALAYGQTVKLRFFGRSVWYLFQNHHGRVGVGHGSFSDHIVEEELTWRWHCMSDSETTVVVSIDSWRPAICMCHLFFSLLLLSSIFQRKVWENAGATRLARPTLSPNIWKQKYEVFLRFNPLSIR